ncbi:MAG: FtsX-like permease family protein [Candidatus Margulisbacteria bacterium]|nr:FtsX-like permease family protein [Candidatus Margulisiibacteriota bacterium]
MFLLIAWRNIIVNKRRSLISIFLSAFLTVLLIFFIAWQDGQHEKMIRDSIEAYTGYVQIQGLNFQKYPDYEHLVYNLQEVKQKIKHVPGIKHSSERFETFALYSAQSDSIGGLLIGIVPSTEQYVSRLKRSVIQGRFLKDTDGADVLVGKDMAERLKIQIGDKLTFISQALDYSTAADILTVKGIFNTASALDFNAAFINKNYMDSQFLSDNTASAIVIMPVKKQLYKLDNLTAAINKVLDTKKNIAVSWQTILSSLVQLVNMDSAFGYLSYGILLVVVFFVIMIFSLINIFQRTKEIGVLKAIGTKPSQIFRMIIGESFLLGFISVIIGGIIGLLLIYYFNIHPIEIKVSKEILDQYKKWGIMDFNFPTLVSYALVLKVCFIVLAMNIVAALYPIYKVNRFKPIEAINYI